MPKTIWKQSIDLNVLHERQRGTFADFLGIEFFEILADGLLARVEIKEHFLQPAGIMHGGFSCVFAETVGSTAANFCVEQDLFYCVGLDINTNHIAQATCETVIAKATPFHIGKSTQVWHIAIHNEQARLISINRLTMAVLQKETKQ